VNTWAGFHEIGVLIIVALVAIMLPDRMLRVTR